MENNRKLKILVTAIGGHSYGAQIAKSLSLLKGKYELYGTDALQQEIVSEISVERFCILPKASSDSYLSALVSLYKRENIDFLIDGSEAEQKILNENRAFLLENDVNWISNNKEVLDTCLNKIKFAGFLKKNNFLFPKTYLNYLDEAVIFPVILKPNLHSGGSSNVYIAQSREDVNAVLQLSKIRLEDFCIQEYVGDSESEYTVGILHNNKGKFLGSATLKRDLTQPLSVKTVAKNLTNRTELGEKLVISSGFSQGILMQHKLIEDYCRMVAEKLGSTGALNFQGRLKNDKFYIFEINPRFSGTSFMRALSDFNEADLWVKNLDNIDEIDPFYITKNAYYKRMVKEIKI